jgi:hypothetical protein
VGEIVIGRYPFYVAEAIRRRARCFSIPVDVWDGMTEEQRWEANRRFLDEAVERGDEVILATALEDAGHGYFRKELAYLHSLGYRPSSDGKRLVRTEP